MRYALIENNVVANIISLNPRNASEFSNAVATGTRPVAVGDTYADGHFYRAGVEVLTTIERLAAADAAIAELDSALIEAEYEAIIGGLTL